MTLNLLLKFLMTNFRISPGLEELFTGVFVDPELVVCNAEKLALRSPAILMSSSIVCFLSFATEPRKLWAGDRTNLFRELLVDWFESKL